MFHFPYTMLPPWGVKQENWLLEEVLGMGHATCEWKEFTEWISSSLVVVVPHEKVLL